MPFAYRQVTVSGHRVDTEGTSTALNEIADVLVNEMGWTMEDDRRSQNGSSNVALTHKIVLNSNGGEGGHPNWFVTLTSGTTATAGSDTIGMQLATAYDTGTHDTAASGIETPTIHTSLNLNVDPDGPYTLWISGDKDGVVLVSQRHGDLMNWMTFGRGRHFLDDTLEPYGIYCYAQANNTLPTATAVRSIVGEPPVSLNGGAEGEFIAYTLTSTNDPRTGLGNDQDIWVILPILFTADDASPVRKGAIGFTNFFMAGNSNAGMLTPAEYTDEQTGRSYVFFGSSSTLVIRKS
jgi:hypothetical protein